MTNKPDSEYTLGVDISKYDVVYNDYTKRITELWNPDNSTKRIDFVIQRCSYGMHQDQFVNELYEQVKKVKVRGAYHYFTSGIGWKVQLETILAVTCNKDYQFFAIDYEKIYNNLNATSFAEMMELAKQLKLTTGKKVILYFNVDVYNNYMKPYGADNVINQFDIWFAQYPYIQYLDLNNLPPLLPKNIKNCKIFQFAGDVQGTRGYLEGKDWGTPAKSVDINLFYGSISDLYKWAGIDDTTPPTEPDPPIIEEPSRYTGSVLPTTILGLQVRESPITGLKIGKLNLNQNFEGDILVNIQNDKWLHITTPYIGWISAKYTKYVDHEEIVNNPELKPAIPGPFYLLSHQEVGEGWFWPSGKLDAYPAIIPKIKGGSGFVHLSGDDQTRLDQKPTTGFMKALRNIMTDLQWKQEWQQDFGWHNSGSIGTVREVIFAHNKVWITGVNSDGFYEYDSYYNTDSPPNLNIEYDQYRQGVITVDYKYGHDDTGGVINTDNRIPYLVIANDRTEKLRVDPKYLKPLLYLPVTCKVKTNGINLNIRKLPVDGEIIGSYKNGESVEILELIKYENKIWGRTAKGWIAVYLTDLEI